MNDQKIYQYLARKPDSCAQDVADFIDVDLKDASDELRSLVDVGDLVRHAGIARNGLPKQLYNLSESFKASRAGVALLAAVALTQAQAPEPEPEPAPVVEAEPAPAAAPAAEAPPMSRAARAIAYIKEKGCAGDAELRAVMGMRTAEYPSSVLTSSVKKGLVVRDGLVWRIGKGTPPPPLRMVKDAAFNPANGPVLPPTPVARAAPPPPAPPPPEAAPAVLVAVSSAQQQNRSGAVSLMVVTNNASAPFAPSFRCGLWSDGVLELQRNGRSVVELTRGEGEQLVDFMNRMLRAVPAAA